MADDLDDEWWLNDKHLDKSPEVRSPDTEHESQVHSGLKKRKTTTADASEIESNAKRHKLLSAVSRDDTNTQTKKKKKKKNSNYIEDGKSNANQSQSISVNNSTERTSEMQSEKAVEKPNVCEDTTQNGTSLAKKKKKINNAMKECAGNSDVSLEGVSKSEEKKKSKKKKRKSISVALANQKLIPLTPWDLTSKINTYYKSKLTAVEMDELKLSVDNFAACNDLTHTPTSYLKSLAPHWKKFVKQMSDQPGSPLFIIICSSGQRAADFIRLIADLKVEGCKIAKLFAKHMKLEEQTKFLRTQKMHIGVGTPNRIYQLIENGALSLDQVKFVVLDWSWRDVKLHRLIDLKEVCNDVMTLLSKNIIPNVRKTSLKIGLL